MPRGQIRFGQVLTACLSADGLDARDWLWLPPDEIAPDSGGEAILEKMDPRRRADLWDVRFAAPPSPPIPDFARIVAPDMARRFAVVIVGGFGSHLTPARVFEEADALNAPTPWIYQLPYGNTLASDQICADSAAGDARRLIASGALGSRRILFLAHSRGANIVLAILTDPRHADIRDRTWGVLAWAGAIGGSPAADSLLARAVRRSRKAPRVIRRGVSAFWRLLSSVGGHPAWVGLPSLEDLPDGIADLSWERRRALLDELTLPLEIRFFSVAAVVGRGGARLMRLFSRDFDRVFLYLAGYELDRHGLLNDTQVLLPDAQWPHAPNTSHLGTVRTDHWGLVYRQVLPGSTPDPTPRKALLAAALTTIWEKVLEEGPGIQIR